MKLAIALNLVACLMLATSALADIELRYEWDAATTGTEAVQYQVQTIRAGEDWTDFALVETNAVAVTVPDGVQDFQVKVAGVDLLGRVGPWSAPSETYSDSGPPGMPGTPRLIGAILAVLGAFLLVLFFRKENKDAE